MGDAKETARALEIILSRLKFDPETTRILKSHLTSQREAASRAAQRGE